MKKFILFFTTIAIISCQPKEPANYTLVSGNVSNNTENSLKIANNTIKINEDGSFIDTLRLDSGVYFINTGNNKAPIYIENGFNIKINYNTNNFENTLTYSGEGAEPSIYLLEKNKIEKDLMGERKPFYALNEADYLAKILEIKTAKENALNSKENISESFKTKELRNINYEYLNKINIYEVYHEYFAELDDFKVSENFENELQFIDYTNEEDYKFSADYKNLVESNFMDKASVLAEKKDIEEDIAFLQVVSEIESDFIRNHLLFNNAYYGITYTDNVGEYYNAFMNGSTNEENNAIITESYNKLKTLSKGQPSPKFEDYENFNGGKTSLEDFKGKYVYIDVWATWCGPCKSEIPYLKELEKTYRKKNIEFISISIDNINGKRGSYESWKNMVEEKDLQGTQLFADNDWKSNFIQEYLIKGIPRFILIDPEGNIVKANAPEPSNEKITELFNELNI